MKFFKESGMHKLPCPACGADFEFVADRLEGTGKHFTLDFLWNCECWHNDSRVHGLMDEAFEVAIKDLKQKERENILYWLALHSYLLYLDGIVNPLRSLRYKFLLYREAGAKKRQEKEFKKWEEDNLRRWNGRK